MRLNRRLIPPSLLRIVRLINQTIHIKNLRIIISGITTSRHQVIIRIRLRVIKRAMGQAIIHLNLQVEEIINHLLIQLKKVVVIHLKRTSLIV